jgi:putative transposase
LAQKKTKADLPAKEKRSLIDWNHSKLKVKRQCELIGLPRSTAYHNAVKSKPSEDEIEIRNAIDQIHYKEPSSVVRRIRNKLHELGFKKIGRRLVKRYMRFNLLNLPSALIHD